MQRGDGSSPPLSLPFARPACPTAGRKPARATSILPGPSPPSRAHGEVGHDLRGHRAACGHFHFQNLDLTAGRGPQNFELPAQAE